MRANLLIHFAKKAIQKKFTQKPLKGKG